MTEPENRDRVVITPASAPLSRQDDPRRPRLPKPSPGTFVLAGVLVALLAVATWIVFVLPDHVDDVQTVAIDASPDDVQPAGDNGNFDASVEDIVPPFRESELAKAKEQANATIAEVVELQRLLEQEMNVESWASEAYATVLDQAIEGDRLFEEARYLEAQAGYEAAAEGLSALRDEGLAEVEDAVTRGGAALDALASEEAAAAFAEALAIQADNAQALAGADRAALQPQVLELVRAGERARLRGDLKRADELFRQARSQDPLTRGVDDKIREVQAARAEIAYREALSAAFAALERGEFDDAEAAFNRVLATRPEDAGALAGLQQTGQRRTLSRIDMLRAQAAVQEDADDWDGALATFDAALEIDPSLQFARDGRARLRLRVEIARDMDTILADPTALSEDALFDEAQALLANARAQAGAGGAFEAKSRALAELLSRAAEPVELALVSDNATDVVIQKVATLGSFKRHALNLRPGRYVIVGSRDGFRDVRVEVLLEAGLPPVTVRCEERI